MSFEIPAKPSAPTLPAYEVTRIRVVRWFVWCNHCRDWHVHGPAPGHREAHCRGQESPYYRTGYNLKLVGKMSQTQARREAEARRKTMPLVITRPIPKFKWH